MNKHDYEVDAEYCFTDLLGTMSLEEFYSQYWDRKPVILRPNRVPLCLENLTRQAVLDWYLQDAREDRRLTTFNVDEPKLSDCRRRLDALFSNDVTISALDDLAKEEAFIARYLKSHPRFEPFMRSCTRFWKARCSLNLYLLHIDSDRFPVHQDSHHIFAIHTFGIKRWLFWSPTIEWPMSRYDWIKEKEPTSEPSVFEVREGEVLYVPLGWRHRTENISQSTVHLSLGPRPVRWAEIIEKVVYASAARHAGMRADIPFSVSEEGVEYDLDYSKDIRLLLELISKDLDESLLSSLDEFIAR